MKTNNLTRLFVVSLILAVPATGAWAELEEITVTARKRTESLLEIPVSVTALSQDDINDRGILDTESLSQFTPGFEMNNLGQGGTSGRENPGIRFRGINVQQSQPASRAGAVFWNGAYVSDGIGVLPLIDLERAEIIKGPQNAVFGRNTFAGAVNYLPAQPGDEFNGRISVSLVPDDDDSRTISTAIGGPITDRISGRIALTDIVKGGYYEYENGDPLGREETQAVMGSLVFDVNDNTSITYSGFYVDSEDSRTLVSQRGNVAAGDCNLTYSGNFRNVATGANTGSFSTDLSQSTRATFCGSLPDWDDVPPDTPLVGTPNASTSVQPFSGGWDYVNTAPVELEGAGISRPSGLGNAYEVTRHHLSANIDLDNDFSLSGFYSVGNSQHWGIIDANYGTATVLGDGNWAGFVKEVEDSSAEIRLISPSDQRLRYSLGLSWYEQDTTQSQFNQFAGFAANFLMIPGAPLSPPDVQIGEGSNVGVFGSLDFDINESFNLSLEGRWNEDEQTIVFEGQSGTAGGAANGRSQSYSAFMPRVILSWQPSDNLNVYGSYSVSFLQGIATLAEGYAASVLDANGDPVLQASDFGFFTPRQELNAFELGVKHAVNDRLSYTASLYTMKWDNQTFFELSPTFVSLNLSGDSEYTGLDLEFNAQVTDWLGLVGGLSFTDAELTDFAGAGSVATAVLAPNLAVTPGLGNQIDASGNVPRYVPDTTGSLSAVLDFGDVGNMPFGFRIDAVHTGDFFIDNFEYNEVSAHTKFNVRATLGVTENVNLELYGLNVTDDRSWATAGGTTSITFSPDRKTFGIPTRGDEYGLRITADF